MQEDDLFFKMLARKQAMDPYGYPNWTMARTEGAAVRRVSMNAHGRDFFVGDLHGMFGLLALLLKERGFNPETDRLFSVGDLIDRGPDNLEALHWLQQPWFHAVLGNHDHMALDALVSIEAKDIWINFNGGDWAEDADPEQLNALCERLATLPYALEIEHSSGWVGVVHADVPLEISWSYYMHRLTLERRGDAPPIAIRAATWGRERIRTYTKDDAPLVHGIEHVISGHTTVNTPTWLGNVVYVDTGAYRSRGSLTVATLEDLLGWRDT
jgi:serine/threonine protein phosphatase 1